MLSAVIWQNRELLALAVALVCAALAALLWLYPPQIRTGVGGIVRGRWRWTLPVLRALVIVALAVSLLKPVAARTKPTADRRRVVLLVDQSPSMGVNDAGRTPAQKVSLARALGLIGAEKNVSPVEGLGGEAANLRQTLEQVWRARSEAEYARLSGRGVDSTRQRLDESATALRTSASALASRAPALRSTPDLSKQIASLRKLPSPLDERALRDLRALLERISTSVAVVEEQADEATYRADGRIRSICDELDQASRLELAQRALGSQPMRELLGGSGELIGYAFAGAVTPVEPGTILIPRQSDRTDITGAIRWVTEGLRGERPSAIVLVSDGRESGAGAADDALGATTGGIPVFALGVSGGQERRDVSVRAIRAPQAAFVGETVMIRVELRAVNCRDQSLEIALETPAGKQTRRIEVGTAREVIAEFPVTFTRAGLVNLRAAVAPLEGEATDVNNAAEVWLKVLAGQVSVMVISSRQTREAQSVVDALRAAPWISVHHSALAADDELAPLTSERINQQDLVVLCDVKSWSLGDAQWSAIEKLVTDHAGAIVFAVGDSEVLRGYAEHSVAKRLLPFDPEGADVSWRVWPGDEPHYLLSPAAWSGAADPVQQPQWGSLSRVMAYVSMPQLNPNARALLVERETRVAVLAEARFALGRSYVLGTDETWRWREPRTGSDLFWQPLVRRAIEQPYAAHEQNHWLDVQEVSVLPGQAAHVRAKVLREDGSPSGASWQELQIVKDGQFIRTARLTPAFTVGPGRYETALTDLDEGQYELRLSTGDDLVPAPRVSFWVARETPGQSPELSDLSGDPRFLARLAQATGGQYMPLEQISSLPRRLAELRDRQPPQMIEYSLWDSPYLFLFVLAALSLEWALRKGAGLA